MDDITMEKKMKLVQQIRNQYNQNQHDLSNREQILYETSTINSDEGVVAAESLKLRSALAVMLLLFTILFDLMGITPAGIEMQKVFETIAADYQENITAFVDAMTEENILE